jgi:hypothetical protein
VHDHLRVRLHQAPFDDHLPQQLHPAKTAS